MTCLKGDKKIYINLKNMDENSFSVYLLMSIIVNEVNPEKKRDIKMESKWGSIISLCAINKSERVQSPEGHAKSGPVLLFQVIIF